MCNRASPHLSTHVFSLPLLYFIFSRNVSFLSHPSAGKITSWLLHSFQHSGPRTLARRLGLVSSTKTKKLSALDITVRSVIVCGGAVVCIWHGLAEYTRSQPRHPRSVAWIDVVADSPFPFLCRHIKKECQTVAMMMSCRGMWLRLPCWTQRPRT